MVGLLGCVLGREQHVRVVRQHDRLVRIELLEGRDELRRGRVGGLPARHDPDRPHGLRERLEEQPVSLACDDGDDAALDARGRDE